MATTGTNYTAKWELVDGVLTISPVSGNSGEMRGAWTYVSNHPYLKEVVDMTDEEWLSVTHIVFVESIKIKMQDFMGSNYSPMVQSLFAQSSPYLSYGDFSLSNVTSIDVRGLDTTGCTSFRYMFVHLTSLVEIIGLDALDTSSVNNYNEMFTSTSLSELDLSSFSNMNIANISNIFSDMNYLESVILPNNFSRTSPALNNEETIYKAIGMASSRIPATNQQTQVTIMSDNDFFSLETGQGGTWIRHISGSATLSFKINSVQRDGNNVTVSYSYATSTATAYVYLKESSASSFPQTPTETISLTGSGNGTLNLTLATDSSYEMQFIVSDGETNLYVFTSIDSNVLLFALNAIGDTTQSGRATTKDMTSEEIQDFVDGLEFNGGGNQVQTRNLLWTNTTSTTTFSAQTISLDLSEYDYVEIWFFSPNSAAWAQNDAMLPNPICVGVGESRAIVYFHSLLITGVNENTGARGIDANANGVVFDNYAYKNRRSGGGLTTANNFAIPRCIYGIKYL